MSIVNTDTRQLSGLPIWRFALILLLVFLPVQRIAPYDEPRYTVVWRAAAAQDKDEELTLARMQMLIQRLIERNSMLEEQAAKMREFISTGKNCT